MRRVQEYLKEVDGESLVSAYLYEHPINLQEVDASEVEEDDKVPHYDSVSRTWKVVTECGKEEGNALYIASEFIRGGLIYPFHSEPPEKEVHCNHAHEFSSVVEFLFKKPNYFSLEGFEEYYSEQEIDLLVSLRDKLGVRK